MRRSVPVLSLALLLGACASLPSDPLPLASDLAAVEGAPSGLVAAADADHLNRSQMAQLRDIAEAEARVDLARARLDLATIRREGAENGDVRDFLEARRALRDARNVYGPTDTGRRDWRLNPFGYGRTWPRGWPRQRGWGLTASDSPDMTSGAAMPLSGQSGLR